MSGKKLLVADDSLTIQKVIRLALSNEGYEIQAVSEGNDAIQQISLFRPDIVLIDVSLPGKSAFEVKREVNEHPDLEEVRFILMSSAFEKVDEAQAAQVLFHGRLTKPFDPAHLRQVLSSALAQVKAKRLEATSIIERPLNPQATPPPIPSAPSVPQTPAAPFTTSTPDFPVSPPRHVSHDLPADDVFKPMASDQPIVTPPPPEELEDLWEQEADLTELPASTVIGFTESSSRDGFPVPPSRPFPPIPTPAPPAPSAAPPPAMARRSDDSDIRELTESTIRMSGLADKGAQERPINDEFEWSVNEPSLRPPAKMLDPFEMPMQVDVQDDPPIVPQAFGSDSPPSIPGLPAHKNERRSAASPADFYRDPSSTPVTIGAPPLPAVPSLDVIGIPQDQMEALVRQQVREMFQNMAEKILPDMAEKIIKQEIHKMLSDS